jgi:hypothetical protein
LLVSILVKAVDLQYLSFLIKVVADLHYLSFLVVVVVVVVAVDLH